MSKDSWESLINDLSNNTLAYNSDRGALVDNKPDLKAQTTRLGTIYYRDINLFLLRNLNNLERDILMVEVDFRNLKGRPEGIDR